MRRYFRRGDSGPDAVVERYCQSGRSPQVRRRDPGAGVAGASAEHHSGGRYGDQGGRHRPEGFGRDRFYPRAGIARLVDGRGFVRQGAVAVAGYSDDGRQSPARAHFVPFHRSARPAVGTSAIPVPVSAGVGRSFADRVGKGLRRDGDRRHDDRRCRRGSFRQMRQGDGTAVSGRPGNRQTG